VEPFLQNALIVTVGTLLGVPLALLTLLRREDERLLDLGLGFTGGVMLVASFTSLILPGVEGWGFWQVGLGILGGVALIRLLDLFTPHEHLMRGYEGPPELANKVKRSWLVTLAIIIHNIPEGLAVGVSTAYHVELGFVTALAIAIQDVPEGVAVVMPLLRYRLVRTAVAVGVLSALVEGGAAAVSGVAAASLPSVLGLAMGVAGGAMLYVTVAELYPDIYAEGKRKAYPTFGFITGVLLMLYLDTAFSPS
jgi:ZIP family zinc transporter